MRVAEKIILAVFLFILVVMTGIGGYAITNAVDNASTNEAARANRERIILLESLQASLFETETAIRAYALTGDRSFREEYQAFRKELLRSQEEFSARHFPGATETLKHELSDLVDRRLALLEELITLRDEQGLNAASAFVATRQGKHLMDEIRTIIKQLEQDELEQMNNNHQRVINNAEQLIVIICIGAILNLLLLIAAFLLLRRELKNRSRLVEQLRATTDEIRLSSQFNNSLQSCESHQEARPVIEHYMKLLFPNLSGALYIMRSSRNLLQLGSSWKHDANTAPYTELIEPQDCWALRLGKTHHVINPQKDLQCNHNHDQTNTRTICIPMMARGEIIGLMHLQLNDEYEREHTMMFAETLGAQIATALANIKP